MKRIQQIAAVAALAVITCGTAAAGTLSGSIHNGTNGKAGAGLDVILIQLQGGMQPVATVKADGEGHFTFDRPEIGAAPMLIRVNYRGVNYHEPVPPGKTSVDVQIFEPTDKPASVQVTGHDIVIQPSGTTLLIGEEFAIENNTNPPVAYYRNEGTFDFLIPKGATLGQVSAWSPAGMPVVQGTIDKGKDRDAIAFAFRPGKNGVRISYQMPYTAGQATVSMASLYPSKSVLLVAPPGVQISAAGFAAAGQQEGWNIYGHDALAANAPIQISVSGTGPAPADANAGGGGGGDNSGGAMGGGGASDPSVNSRATGTGETVAAMPDRLENLKWILIAGFAALFALGAVYLWRRPQGVMAAAGGAGVIAAPLQSRSERATVAVTPASTSAAPSAVAQVNGEVRGSLDDLKEKLFRLELRHQAGTISEEEYERQRAQFERTLRDLVRG